MVFQELKVVVRRPAFWIVIILIFMCLCIYYRWQDWFDWYWSYFMFEFRYYIIGMPLLLPFLYSAVVFRWRISIILWGFVLITLVPVIAHYHSANTIAIFINIAFLLTPITITTMIALLINWRERQREIMAEMDKERQIYMNKILKAQEDERQRIAQELHDDTTQTLVALASDISTLVSRVKRKGGLIQIEDVSPIREAIVGVIEELRRLCLDLRPTILDTMGLMPALNWLVNKIQQECGIETRLVLNSEPRPLTPEEDVIIFRIVQEALNNIRKHSKATKASIALEFLPSKLKITIEDNGKGFAVPESILTFSLEGKLGLIGISQRARALDGTLNIQSEVGKASTLLLELPI